MPLEKSKKMKNNLKIYCIIPAFNESKNISRVVRNVKAEVGEVVVVDDGSEDNTAELAAQAGAIVLRHLLNRGQGAALETGNQYAQNAEADIVVHFDADGQFVAKEISDVLKPILNENYQAVLGSRFLGRSTNMPWLKKRIFFPLGRLANRSLLGVRLSDPQSGFRALSKEALKKITITNDGSAHCSEILYKIIKQGIKFKEVPITVKYHGFGQSFFGGKGRRSGGLKIINDLIINKIIDK